MADTVTSRIQNTEVPEYYSQYYTELQKETDRIFNAASKAKSSLADSSAVIDSKIAFDLADRVAKMHEIEIADPLRNLLTTNGKEMSALLMATDIALGKYQPPETPLEGRLDTAVRVGLAIVTEGVTIAPLQGISAVRIKKNKDGSEYLSVSIAGPMRSAGGTESAVTILIADHVRKTAGLSKYQANSFDDETGRFVEELRIYEREAGNFQYHILDEDIVTAIKNLPVELDGVDTDPFEVVNHKGMQRIETDRVRGGALRVLNDGIVGRAKKLTKRIEMYKLEGWEWLADLKGAVQTGDKEEDASAKRMREVITGRSVLSAPKKLGGFRLRYGRSCNTGFASVGLHPVIAEVLDHTITVGTQIKIDMPSKGATVAFVDSIDTPTVRLDNGDVVRIRDTRHGIELKHRIAEIIHLGDILISFGDFLENNAQLVPTGYVEEFWSAELKEIIAKHPSETHLSEFLSRPPTLYEALAMSRQFAIPLHPKYLYYWDQITPEELDTLLKPSDTAQGQITYPVSCKEILERLAVPHKLAGDSVVLGGDEAGVFNSLLFEKRPEPDGPKSVLDALSASGVPIRPKFSTAIGVRIGRPEKAAPRQMKPPIHALFPIGEKGGNIRDILRQVSDRFETTISNRRCTKCDRASISLRCRKCGETTAAYHVCYACGPVTDDEACPKCGKKTRLYSKQEFPLREELTLTQERVRIRAKSPFKGVKELIGQDRIPEPLEKGLIRQHLKLTVFKDGTIRYDATNSPLTHFCPSWIGTSIEKLHELGYTHDIDGNRLERPDQMVELRMQDVVIPYECAEHLVSVCDYINRELKDLFGKSHFYDVHNTDDLLGHLIIGLAPHTSVGIVGRIVGYTNTHVCFGTPNWHSAKRRDADGDADSVMLFMDALLNFSRQFLSDKIGGLMDAPLLIQPMVLPHESQPQAHNLEVVRDIPLEFFKDTLECKKAAIVKSIDIIKSRIDTPEQFHNYHYTHPTSTLTTTKSRSAYSTLGSMLDKLDLQIKNAELIQAVDADEIVSNLISTHLVPDIMGNLRSYAGQKFRCTSCNRSYRRPPLTGRCACSAKLLQTITRPSIEKYLKLAIRLVEKYNVGLYQKCRIHALADEIDLVFGKSADDQTLLTDYN